LLQLLERHPHQAVPLPISLPSAMQDGYLVHLAVLARQLNALLLPRQVLLAGPPGERVGAVSFVHGVPQASTVAGITYAQDKRLRRTLLNMAGLPTPPGITFSSRGSKNLQQFVSRTGYPFVLKEAIGENPSFKIDNIVNEEQLMVAISRMRLRSEDQLSPARSLITSAYAEDKLNFEEDELGNRIAPPHARLLIEKRVSGRYLRCLVCGDRVLAAIEIDKTGPERCVEVLGRLHEDFRNVALRAASVVPGLSVASVDLVVEDLARAPDNQTYYIVELCERPRLDSYMEASSELGPDLANELVRYQAARASVQLEDPTDRIAVRVRAESLSEPNALLPLFRDTCNALRLSGSIELADPVEGIVEGHIQGAPSAAALVMEALMSGVHFGQRAMAADIWQTPMESYPDFRIA
jgi:hypothetical protein